MHTGKRVAVVTGGSSGIGFGTASALIKNNYAVVIIGRDEKRLIDATSKLGSSARWRKADVSRWDEVSEAISVLDRVDVLVNAAGFIKPVSLATPIQEAEADWDAVINANLKGSFLMAKAVAPLLSSPGGRIINISSIGAQTGGSKPGGLAYASAKAGLHGLTFALARELSQKGITANAIAPGFIADTGFTGSWSTERIAEIVAETPAGRAGSPDDIAGAILWLASDAGAFVTGTIIPINGGWRMG
ncbi:SDR family oxidoreductase [Escherichia coli]|nr:SDR family oxidoreductase [Escherichia coli]EJB0176952.1 SDR family oxidoreductase [Escherichia coli]EJY9085817.1 SDR family oxidoreductase [Escherichia coli]EKF5716271.1 SDR family oxidoreductase [Escherichia coli]EKG8481463.1 SDR family oxidoreductase [Escherichia coli]